MEFVGKTVTKSFKGFGLFTGTVQSYDPVSGFFEIVYEDGDSEELDFSEVASLLEGKAEPIEERPRPGRKPKKRLRVEAKQREIRGDSGNNVCGILAGGEESLRKEGEVGGVLRETVGVNGNLSASVSLADGFPEIMRKSDPVNGNSAINLSSNDSFVQVTKKKIGAKKNLCKDVNLNDSLDLNADLNLNLNAELDSGDEINLNVPGDGHVRMNRRESIDLNLVVNEDVDGDLEGTDLGCSFEESGKRECSFDLNVGAFDEMKHDTDGGCGGQAEEYTLLHEVEVIQLMEAVENVKGMHIDVECGIVNENLDFPVAGDSSLGLVEEIPKEDGVFGEDFKALDAAEQKEHVFEATTTISNGYNADRGSSYKQVSSRRKRRKLSESSSLTTERVLRRSARRGSVRNDMSSSSSANDLSSSVISVVTEEKVEISRCDVAEMCFTLPPKLQLPQSSQKLDLNGIPVLDAFSVYTCLRSFSTLLFLSPFELEDFVVALKSKSPSSLFDCIHFSILQTLRKHLEFLSGEGSESASCCLRSLNWALLDLLTWPVFVVEYLLIHGSGLNPGFDLSHLDLFKFDYYKLPVHVKIEILRCLCDDMIEVEAVRSELNRRSFAAEADLDFDRNVDVEGCKRKRSAIDVSGGSCLTDVVVDDTTDWNSDECCLCKMDGSLICCDGCPAAYHSKCVGVANDLLPEGEWYCPECALDRHQPWVKPRKSLRGAELLGNDPHGRLYFRSCDYLLVSDSSEAEFSFSYYHRNDLNAVIDVLKTSDAYNGIIKAINKQWDIPVCLNGSNSNLDFENCKSSIVTEAPCISSEGSAEMAHSGMKNLQKQVPDSSNGLTEFSNQFEAPGKPQPLEDCFLTSVKLVAKQENTTELLASCHTSPVISTRKEDFSELQTSYINDYSFAQTASTVAEELMHKSSDKFNADFIKSNEEMISAQMKVISKNSSRFYWPNMQNLNLGAAKEKCGWCFSCKAPSDDMDCLFNMNMGPTRRGINSEVLGLQSKRNKNGHLVEVISHIIFMEDRLHGLLSGPWLNPHYTKLWHKSVLKASDLMSVKDSLLRLESNLHPRTISAEWTKHVDSVVTMGSACHVVTAASSKQGATRKRPRYSGVENTPSFNAAGGLGMCWWRGGRLSHQVFSWKVLPSSLASKAARKAGSVKIPGVFYPEGSDFAKRTKCVAWRAAVESSTSVEQLALQVRELDSNIKWDDIENSSPLSIFDKEFRKSTRLFKKVIVRRKSSEQEGAKYLLDFGKRRSIPDIVVKHGCKVEEPSSERKKYWLNESYLPLHLLKSFEDKRITRKSNKMSSDKLAGTGTVMKKSSKLRGFSYLFAKAERSEYCQCGHCNKDVPIREAVSCQYCKGFFHKRHVRKSAGSISAECTYTCHRCRSGKFVKISKEPEKSDTKKGKINTKTVKVKPQNSRKASMNARSARLENSKKSSVGGQLVQSKYTKKVTAGIPLRRSARNVKQVSFQNKQLRGYKKKKQKSSRKKASRKQKKVGSWQKKRTKVYHSYWLNGLLLSGKPVDKRVMKFRRRNLVIVEQRTSRGDPPKCIICREERYTSTLNYIACEICGEWFHGDAYGLNTENISKLSGFRCHSCLCRASPVCPHTLNSGLTEAPNSLLPVEVNPNQPSHSNRDLQKSCLVDDCSSKEQLSTSEAANFVCRTSNEDTDIQISNNDLKPGILTTDKMNIMETEPSSGWEKAKDGVVENNCPEMPS